MTQSLNIEIESQSICREKNEWWIQGSNLHIGK